MSNVVRREVRLPQSREQVWRALTTSEALADWMYPNDFEPVVGHRFTFRVPPNPKAKFDGLVVHCEVLTLDPPSRLEFSWSAFGPVVDTRVLFRLEPDGAGTRLFLEHSGFDLSQPYADQAFKGADYGWARMLKQLTGAVAGRAKRTPDAG